MIDKYMNSVNRLKINGSSILILKTHKKEEYQEFIGSELLMERFTQYYDVKFNQLSLN